MINKAIALAKIEAVILRITSRQTVEINPEQTSTLQNEHCVLVCQYKYCLTAGSTEVLAAFEAADVPGYTVKGTGCQGQCTSGPTVRIVPEETWYWQVQPSDVPLIVEQHLKEGKPLEAKLNSRIHLRFSF